MTTEDDQVLAPDHWDRRYSETDGEVPVHEWYCSISELEPFFFRNNLFGLQSFKAEDNPRILHLSQTGYPTADQSSVQVIPAEFAQRHSKVEGIEREHMLDAIIHSSPWNPPREVKENASKYLKEIGLPLLLITLQGPPSTEGSRGVSMRHVQTTHFIKPLLNLDDL